MGAGRNPGPPPSPAASRAARSFPWGLSLLSAFAGATAALGVVLIAGGLGSSTLERRIAEPVGEPAAIRTLPASVRPGGVAEIATAFAPAVVRIELGDGAVATGVLLDDEGTLITTAHGLADDETVPVVLAGGERLTATLVGTDAWTDLAVLQVAHAGGGATLGASGLVAAGDPALVMAAPLGSSETPTVTVGVVRAVEDALAMGERTLRGLFRADAGLVAEASGGALLDQRGALVGIVTVPPGGERSGTGWAVPLQLAQQVAGDLLVHGHARHVWLGIEGADAPEGGGVLVDEVSQDSPAADAGVQPTDRIIAVGGAEVHSMADLVGALRAHEPGDEVDLEVQRGEQRTTVPVRLAERGSA
jgi:putative serine protease PepD